MKKSKIINKTFKLSNRHNCRKAKYNRWRELDTTKISKDDLSVIASFIHNEIKELFTDESVKKEFENWKRTH